MVIQDWFRRHSSDPQVVLLVVILVALVGVVWLVGDSLAPVLAAVIFAYLLQGGVERLESRGMPHLVAVLAAFLFFIVLGGFFLAVLLPLLFRQVTDLARRVPDMAQEAQAALMHLPETYPELISPQQAQQALEKVSAELLGITQLVLSYSLTSVVAAVTVIVYLILVPFLVFFLLKDRDAILDWATGFLPERRPLAERVWREVNTQLAGYVRGKFWEIVIVAAVTWGIFLMIGLDYAALLGAVTGLSVLVPYVGAAVVTLPVALVAYFQWGLAWEFVYAVSAYGLVQALDGNVLAPLLLGGAVNVHPVAVIVAVLFFGAVWGFWGVFFAIPLAGVIQAVIKAWPQRDEEPPPEAVDAGGEAP